MRVDGWIEMMLVIGIVFAINNILEVCACFWSLICRLTSILP
jgi:hypothetical protein